ncbi:MAG TPA: universal stress protein [Tepidiformaceae bacterium]|nr:universal stress protein [Tepidiformaceae bacterium]
MHVLIALDGSYTSERLVKGVADWAVSSGAQVTLATIINAEMAQDTIARRGFVHALTPAGTQSGQLLGTGEPMPLIAEDRSQAIARAAAERTDYLNDMAQKYFSGLAVNVVTESSEQTSAAIVHLADKVKADVIAVGTHGRSGVKRALLGSVAEQLVRTAHVPVLVIGPGYQAAAG